MVTATAAAAPTGPLLILQAVVMPNPMLGSQAQLRLKLGAPASRLRVRLYSPAWVLMQDIDRSGAWPQGWVSLPLDISALPAGLCYASVRASDADRQSLPLAPLRLVRLR